MKITHDCPQGSHEVFLMDDGTLDTVIEIDGIEFRYAEADRLESGDVKYTWFKETAREACDAGDLLTEDDHG